MVDTEGRLVEFHGRAAAARAAAERRQPRRAPNWDTLFQLAGLTMRRSTGDALNGRRAAYPTSGRRGKDRCPGGPNSGFASKRPRTGAAGLLPDRRSLDPAGPHGRTRRARAPAHRAQRVVGARRDPDRAWRRGRWSRGTTSARAAAIAAARCGYRRPSSSATFVAWLLGATHFSDVEHRIDRFFAAHRHGAVLRGALWLLYLALEPYVRKFWPTDLVSWSRLLAGNVADPQVGRDVLLGCAGRRRSALVCRVERSFRPLLGYPASAAGLRALDVLEGNRRCWRASQR